jgi:hypothetical protein
MAQMFWLEAGIFSSSIHDPELFHSLGYTMRTLSGDTDGALDAEKYETLRNFMEWRTVWSRSSTEDPPSTMVDEAQKVIDGTVDNMVPGATNFIAGWQWPKRNEQGQCLFRYSVGFAVPDKEAIDRFNNDGRFINLYELEMGKYLYGKYFANVEDFEYLVFEAPESDKVTPCEWVDG